jgi:predicted DNA binding CopG/RHH family protein
MRKEYDFTNSVRNPYVRKLKKQVTIRLESDVVEYFKSLASDTGIPYQNLINLYLRDCAIEHRKISLKWIKTANKGVQ